MSQRAHGILLLAAILAFLVVGPDSVDAQHGCDPGNLLPSCNFDTFYGSPPRQVPEGWSAFVLSGDLSYEQTIDTGWGAPSLLMWSDGGTFVAGIYSQVGGLQPGIAYKASVGWGAPNAPMAFGRQLGIDPNGGTDPSSSSIVWGPTHRGDGRILNYVTDGPNIDVSAVAQNSTITVFFLVDHNYSTGANQIFIDAIGLYVDPVQPAPTSTPVPTVAPQPVDTWTAMPAATWTSIPTESPSPTPQATPTESPTLTTTPTLAPTATPTVTPTSTLPPRPTATPQGESTGVGENPAPGMLWGGVGALVASAGLAGMLLRRRPRYQ